MLLDFFAHLSCLRSLQIELLAYSFAKSLTQTASSFADDDDGRLFDRQVQHVRHRLLVRCRLVERLLFAVRRLFNRLPSVVGDAACSLRRVVACQLPCL